MDPAPLSSLETVISSALSSILVLGGTVFLVMLVIAGYNYLNAGSNREAAVKAQKTLSFAFLGLILLLSAWLILNLVSRFLGVDLGTFTIMFS